MATKYPMSELIAERRTVKKFNKDKKVSTDLLKELLEVATWAPNHKLREPWRFIIYNGEGAQIISNNIVEAYTKEGKTKKSPEDLNKQFSSVPAFILVVMINDPQPFVKEEDFAATCALIQNFQLAAWERGLGVFWKTDSFLTLPEFREVVGVEPGEKIAAFLQVGYPDVVPKPRNRTPINDKVTLIDGKEEK